MIKPAIVAINHNDNSSSNSTDILDKLNQLFNGKISKEIQ